ncbi:MAG: SEL1-like repeat protein, partial [Lentisphaeria bacterium]|nr:SEL1-like repeat protein [Lentisphaeria bacterium]
MQSKHMTAKAGRLAALCALLVVSGLHGAWYWPFGGKAKKPAGRGPDPVFGADEQPGIPRTKTKTTPKKEDTVSVERLEKLSKEGNHQAMLALGDIYFTGRAKVKQDYGKAAKLFEQAAGLGNGKAMFNLGLCYDGGFGVGKSLDKARDWYAKAADAGVPEAQLKIAVIAEDSGDYSLAMKYLRQLAEAGNAACMRKVAIFILNGLGDPAPAAEAVELLSRAALKGDIRAQVRLADCYQRGIGAERDYQEMFSWLNMAAQDGDPEAQAKLGYCYQTGMGTVRNTDVAITWYATAAKAGYAPAQVALAACYRDGAGVARDLAKAAEYYRLAAEQGDSLGEYHLGMAYLDGQGVSRNAAEAFRWIERSAKQAFPLAELRLGIMYEEGVGLTANPAEALAWYRRAAAQDEPEALFRLGMCHRHGRATAPDPKAARDCFAR